MNTQKTTVKRALISVSNKTGLVEFARQLAALGIEIISSGGTSQVLKQAQIPAKEISDVTGFPEMMDGRVKTLHPKIHGGILGQRDLHASVAMEHEIAWIDLVVVNLYPFAETIQKPDSTFNDAIENIDIGGPTLIRAAAKNMGWTGVVVDPADYPILLAELNTEGSLSFNTRQRLASKAFTHTAEYDAIIERYLRQTLEKQQATDLNIFPEQVQLSFNKFADLRYGENPHQSACAYELIPKVPGILSAKQLQGKQLSYNNITDADAAFTCVQEFTQAACVIVKHANPCGAATADSIQVAFKRALAADTQSAFGGIIALNRPCDLEIAQSLNSIFMEVIIAPEYSDAALSLLAQKPNLRVLELKPCPPETRPQELKFVQGGLLIQDRDSTVLDLSQLQVVTQAQPTPQVLETMLFAWRVLKHLKSNAILLAKDNVTLGVGTGQVSRIDAVEIALRKAGKNLADSVLASDAFFPFRDSIDRIASGAGVRAIIQPGGSIKDEEVIQACNEHGLAMVFTGQRCFKH